MQLNFQYTTNLNEFDTCFVTSKLILIICNDTVNSFHDIQTSQSDGRAV